MKNHVSLKEARALGLDVEDIEQNRHGHGKGNYRPRSKKRAASKDTLAQKLFLAACTKHGLPGPVAEYRFHPDRKWRFDWLFEGWLAVEIEGGVWTDGRHVRGKGFVADCEKYNEAGIAGYVVLRFPSDQIDDGSAFPVIQRALEGE